MLFGLGMIFHAEPSHCSIRLCSTMPSVIAPPTAQAAVGESALTSNSSLSCNCATLGLGTTRHEAHGVGVAVADGFGVGDFPPLLDVPAPQALTASVSVISRAAPNERA